MQHDGIEFVIRREVENCTYSQCLQYKTDRFILGVLFTDPGSRTVNPNSDKPRKKTIVVTGFEPNSGGPNSGKCLVVGKEPVDGVGTCAMIWVSRRQPKVTLSQSREEEAPR